MCTLLDQKIFFVSDMESWRNDIAVRSDRSVQGSLAKQARDRQLGSLLRTYGTSKPASLLMHIAFTESVHRGQINILPSVPG